MPDGQVSVLVRLFFNYLVTKCAFFTFFLKNSLPCLLLNFIILTFGDVINNFFNT